MRLQSIFYVLTIFFVVFLLVPSSVNAAIYNVSILGNDTNNGISAPFKTIQKAADTASFGDTVMIQAGNYNERVSITRSGTANNLIKYQAQGTVLVQKGFKVVANYININGFEINNSEVDASTWKYDIGAGIYLRGSNNLIENNYIRESSLTGIFLYGTGSDQLTTSNNIIRGNRLFRNVDTGIYLTGTNNIVVDNEIWESVSCHPTKSTVGNCVLRMDANGITFHGTGHQILNNYIHDINMFEPGINPAVGDFNDAYPNDPHIDCFQTWPGGQYDVVGTHILFQGNHCNLLKNNTFNEGGNGWMLDGAGHLTIKNNIVQTRAGINGSAGGNHDITIINNVFVNAPTTNNPQGIELNNVPNAVIKNNIFLNQQLPIIYSPNTNIVVSHNMAWNTNGSTPKCIVNYDFNCISPVPTNNFWGVDPMFVNINNNDFHLQSGSPACNTGESGTHMGAFPCNGSSPTTGPSPTYNIADLEPDGDVDGNDFNILISNFGLTGVLGFIRSDILKNGVVDIFDFNKLITNFGF